MILSPATENGLVRIVLTHRRRVGHTLTYAENGVFAAPVSRWSLSFGAAAVGFFVLAGCWLFIPIAYTVLTQVLFPFESH
jgi:hypothetical protein